MSGTDSLGIDAVYFLMWPGWSRELRSNRWHYASRWARAVPVTLVQPEQQVAEASLDSTEEARLDNVRILRVQSGVYQPSLLRDSLVQLGQVSTDMAKRGVKRPLLWCYNPTLVGLYGAVPAVARVFHATENYFQFENIPRFILDYERAAIRMSDLTVAVSDGVAASIHDNVPGAQVTVVTNGVEPAHVRPVPRARRTPAEVRRRSRLHVDVGSPGGPGP